MDIRVTKTEAWMPVPVELLIDSGAITEEEAYDQGWTGPVLIGRHRVSRIKRARWRLREYSDRIVLAWQVLAGHDIHEDCE